MLNHLSAKVNHVHKTKPNALGDFNVHTEAAGLKAEAFVIAHNFTQLVEVPTHIPVNVNHHQNIFHLFLTADPDKYAVTVNAPSLNQSCFIKPISTN